MAWALAALALSCALAPAAGGCNDGEPLLRAKVVEQRDELVGGPVAMADVGDFLLENDQVRFNILAARDSPGPGVFGGALVDADVRRTRIGFEGAQGRDRFSEMFPLANLMVPDPTSTDVRVIADGSDGKEAAIRVEGEGEFLFEALSILRDYGDLLGSLFSPPATRLRFRTDYALHPGDRWVTIRTTLLLPDDPPDGCQGAGDCPACPAGHAFGPDGCPTCECSPVAPLDVATGPRPVFGTILGDPSSQPDIPAVHRAGIVAGDFVFFGNQNDVFAPGPGFDEDASVQRGYVAGRNSFEQPLTFDFVAAAGGDVSYGYFTKNPGGHDPPVVDVPLFASAATAFLAASKSCLYDTSDDADCDHVRAFSYERYLVVGDGDVASIAEQAWRARGTPMGSVSGHVYWAATGEAVKNARLYVFADPRPGSDKIWRDVDDLVEINLRTRGDEGLVLAMDADRGLDLEEDGDFSAHMPPGDYVLVARDADGTVVSRPERFQIRRDSEVVAAPVLPTPATLRVRATDEGGLLLPAKVTLVALDDKGRALDGDGRRRPYLGDGRLGNQGIRAAVPFGPEPAALAVEPGRYRVIVSRGIEYGVHEEDLHLAEGGVGSVDAVLVHEVDTAGWLGADTHLHATPSFDSGMALDKRVASFVAEQVELAVSTDHDVESDYRPALLALGLEPFATSAVGSETTTLEAGHFIGFPERYDATDVPDHGAHDWTCETGAQILAAIAASGDGMQPLTVVAHPRDGFFGYFDQSGVDPFTFGRTLSLLERTNPAFRTVGCDYDAMEIIQGKRFDFVRTATVAEVVDFNRCMVRVLSAQGATELDAACPELGPEPLASCKEGERFDRCRGRARNELARRTTVRMLERTPAEQDANWRFTGDAEQSQALCDPAKLGELPLPPEILDLPCAYRAGHVDDYFRLLEHGMIRAQLGASDSHGGSKEPGSPRTYFRSATDEPGALSIGDAVANLRGGHAFATYGPFVRATVDGKTFGETATVKKGGKAQLQVEVQSASWFAVDRVEIYVNGELVKVKQLHEPKEALVDLRGELALAVPDRDSWVVVIAMGLSDAGGMGPVAVDVPFGEIQLARVAAEAFALIPVVNALFAAPPTLPDWSPIVPYAVTNAIFLDVDGNGRYDAPLPAPDFCSRPCGGGAPPCPDGQKCLSPENVCGLPVPGSCDHRRLAPGH